MDLPSSRFQSRLLLVKSVSAWNKRFNRFATMNGPKLDPPAGTPFNFKGVHFLTPFVKTQEAAQRFFFTARTWAKPHRFDSSVTLLLRRVVQSKTQWRSNVFKLLKLLQKSSQASKNVLPASPNKTPSSQTHKSPQNSYQISSQHQVPKTWVNQHPKTPKPTKTNENPSPSSSMHKLVPLGSKLVPTWFL